MGINVKLREPNLTFHTYLHHFLIFAPPQKEQNFFLLCYWTSQHKWNVLISKTAKIVFFWLSPLLLISPTLTTIYTLTW